MARLGIKIPSVEGHLAELTSQLFTRADGSGVTSALPIMLDPCKLLIKDTGPLRGLSCLMHMALCLFGVASELAPVW
jgi:hypothetical protein